MDKFEARKKYSLLRKKISNDEIIDFSVKIANNCLNLNIWQYSNYHIFLPIEKKKEVDTSSIINILTGKKKQVVISKSNFKDCSLTNYILDDDVILELNNYGIPEPRNGKKIKTDLIDVVFIPLLAFDKSGNRVGYGKGFYDRFLKELPKKTIKIGLSFFPQEHKLDGIEKHDVKMNYCVTPNDVFTFLEKKIY
jgi:5-formyltetrahydrofolate cyclo-ligase